MQDKIDIGLDPAEAIAALGKMQESVKQLAVDIDTALGRNAQESLQNFQQSASKSTSKVSQFFSDLGKRVKDDMKTAFNLAGVVEGAKFVSEMNAGIRSTFDMEKAFARLQVRMGATGKEFANLRTQLGNGIASTGADVSKVMPGVEIAAGRGGVRDAKELSSIGETIAQANVATGEDGGGMADTIVSILQDQGKKITASSFKETMDALIGARNAGGFNTLADVGASVKGMAGQAKQTGLDTRSMAGLAAAANSSGASGQGILQQLLKQATTIGGREHINAAFGTDLFDKESGKLNVDQFQNVKKDKFGKYSTKLMEDISGVTGGNGEDLSRFLDAMKGNQEKFKAVNSGLNETATSFGVVSKTFGGQIDIFKANMKNATLGIGSGLSEAAGAALQGDGGGVVSGLKHSASAAWDNKGTLAAGTAATAAAGLLAGGAFNALASKLPGGGLLAGAAGGALAEKAGVQQVWVVNAAAIANGGGAGGLPGLGSIPGLGGAAAGAEGGAAGAGLMSGAAGFLMPAMAMAAAAAAGVYGGMKLNDYANNNPDSLLRKVTDPLTTRLAAIVQPKADMPMRRTDLPPPPAELHQQIVGAMKEGLKGATVRMNGPQTNPSAPSSKHLGAR